MASGHISVAQGRDFLLAYMEIARGIASEEMDFFFNYFNIIGKEHHWGVF